MPQRGPMRHYQSSAQTTGGNQVAFNEPPTSLGASTQINANKSFGSAAKTFSTGTVTPTMHVQQHGPPPSASQTQGVS